MSFNAANAYKNIKKDYVNFLLDWTMGPFPHFGDEDRWDKIRNQLKETWESGDTDQGIFAKPVMESLYPYEQTDKSIQALIQDGILNPKMEDFVEKFLLKKDAQGKCENFLYKHQVESIKQSKGKNGKNIIVASGTGSGKTECFLYSMLNNLFESESDEELKKPGVRILIIYPTNALVKDQLKRVLKLVKGKNPKIRVGMYTSQTPEKGNKEWESWERYDESKQAAKENIISTDYYVRNRTDIRNKPPHILITNYSMLEYMQLRSKDNSIFDTGKLQAIVLDEAHTYSGTLGTDIQMLIRRVLLRFNRTNEDVRFYITSATIGDNNHLKEVASALLGVDKKSIVNIGSQRMNPTGQTLVWNNGSAKDKEDLKVLKKKVQKAEDKLIPLEPKDIELLAKLPTKDSESGGVCDEKGNPYLPYKLHTFFNVPNAYYSDMEITDEKPLGNIKADAIFVDKTDQDRSSRTGLQIFSSTTPLLKEIYFKAKVCQQSVNCDNVYALFNANYDSKTLAKAGWKKARDVFFRFRLPLDSERYKGKEADYFFDLIPLSNSAAPDQEQKDGWKVEFKADGRYVLALNQVDTGGNRFDSFFEKDKDQRLEAPDGIKLNESEFAMYNMDFDTGLTDDEDEEDSEDNDGSSPQNRAANGNRMLVPLGFVPHKKRAAIISELLMPYLPDWKEEPKDKASQEDAEKEESKSNSSNPPCRPWNGRQFLFFSDSRKGAAEMAVHLQNAHQFDLIKSYIAQILTNQEMNWDEVVTELIEIDSIVEQFSLAQERYEDAKKNAKKVSKTKADVICDWKKRYLIPSLVFQEIVIQKADPYTLEKCGMIDVSIDSSIQANPESKELEGSLWDKFRDNYINGKDPTDKKKKWQEKILPEIVYIFRRKERVYFPEFFRVLTKNGLVRSFTQDKDTSGEKCEFYAMKKIFLNALGRTGSRFSQELRASDNGIFLNSERFKRLKIKWESIPNLKIPKNPKQKENFLKDLFKILVEYYSVKKLTDESQDLFISRGSASAAKLALNPQILRFKSGQGLKKVTLSEKEMNLKASDKNENTPKERRDVTDTLSTAFVMEKINSKPNYPSGPDFTPDAWGGIRVPEHSAQIESVDLGKLEDQFKNGEINIISCTPTLEIGVDIGGLSSVVLGSLPPEKGNYLQRAGRAGRRNDESALIITFIGGSLLETLVMEDSKKAVFERKNPYAVPELKKNFVKAQLITHINQFLLGEYYLCLEKLLEKAAKEENNPLSRYDHTGNFFGESDVRQQYIDVLRSRLDEEDFDDESKKNKDEDNKKEIDRTGVIDGILSELEAQIQPLSADPMRKTYRSLSFFLERTLLSELNNSPNLKDKYETLVKDTILENEKIENIIYQFQKELDKRTQALNDAFKNIIKKLDNIHNSSKDSDEKETLENALKYQFKNIYTEALISYLIHERLLPAYGFPIDVVTFHAGKHMIQRPIFQGIYEFTPQRKHPVSHELYSIDGLVPNYKEVKAERNPFEKKYLYKCRNCNYAYTAKSVPKKCPICQTDFITENDLDKEDDNAKATCDVYPFVTPSGYYSRSSGEDAANEMNQSGIYFSMIDDLIFDYNFLRNDDLCSFVLRKSDEVNAPKAIRINPGLEKKGYHIDLNTDGGYCRITHKSKDSENADEANEGNEANPHYIEANLACEASVTTLFYRVPYKVCQDSNKLNTDALKRIMMSALLKQTTEILSLDSRVLQYCVKEDGNAVIFCIYDVSGRSSYLEDAYDKKDEILEKTIKSIIASKSRSKCRHQILNYVTGRMLEKLSDKDFEDVSKWVEDNKEFLKKGQDRVNELMVVATNTSNPLTASNGKPITLLYNDFCENDLKYILDFRDHNLQSEINVVINQSAFEQKDPVIQAALSRKICAFMEGHPQLKFYERKFEESKLKSPYDSGVRFKIDKDWYMKRDCKELSEVQLTDNDFFSDCRKVVKKGKEQEQGSWFCKDDFKLVQEREFNDTKVIPIKCGSKYTDLTAEAIWESLKLPLEYIVTNIQYSDPYVNSPQAWRTFLALLKPLLKQRHIDKNATIDITTSLRGDSSLLQSFKNFKEITISQQNDKIVKSDINEEFGRYVARELSIKEENLRLTYPGKVSHDRLLTLEYKINEKTKRVKFYIGCGMSLLHYKNERQKNHSPFIDESLFDEKALTNAVYRDSNGELYIAWRILPDNAK